jgi:glycosyltransferase involved in cell wall biosynthesis
MRGKGAKLKEVPGECLENVVLAGPFDPATLALSMEGDAAGELSATGGSPSLDACSRFSEIEGETSYESETMSKPPVDFQGDIVLAGCYDPAALAPLVGGESGIALSRYHGPPGVPIHDLARGFSRLGVRSTVIGGMRNGPDLHLKSYPLSAALYNRRNGAAFVLDGLSRERRTILKLLQAIQPSIVHAHWTMEAARAVADWDGPKVLTVHDAAYEYARLGWSWDPRSVAFTLRWLVNTSAVFKRFRHIIAISPYVETYLRARHGFRGEIRVIPNAIPPLPDNVHVPETFPKTGCVTFGCYGSPGRLKNIGAALTAFLRVHKELPNSRLLVYGTGWEAKRFMYAHLPIEFRGGQPHSVLLHELGTQVDIWVHPSRIETQGIVICEAIQAGCPVIAGRTSGAVPWTLDYGRAGILVDIENPDDIAAAMLSLVEDRQRANSLVSYGRQMIQERFSPERVIDMHLRFYEEVIDQWKPCSKN